VTELLTLPPPRKRSRRWPPSPTRRSLPPCPAPSRDQTGASARRPRARSFLQATFTDADGSAAFWKALVPLFGLLESAPGFIRRYGFGDGPHNTLIAFWRTAEDARAFAARPEHRAAVRHLYQQRWQHSHFAAIWEMSASHDRMIFCADCPAVTPAARQQCSGCGADLEPPQASGP
jgi:heme-degrading monooxygenase HmoA